MALISVILIKGILKSTSHVNVFYSARENKIFQKDVILAILCITMSILFICLNVPAFVVYYFFKDQIFLNYLFISLHSICYAFNFYLFWAFNSLFRHEFYSMISTRSRRNANIQLEIIN